MDVVSHALWAGAAGEGLRRRRGLDARVVWWTAILGVAPDILPMIPVLAWAFVEPETIAFLYAYVTAVPGSEPHLPLAVHTVSHHLHCALHSVVIAGVATLAVLRWRPAMMIPLAGWWLHIALDIPTHSTSYYAVPFLYPVSDWTFGGVAWTTPWVLAANYLAIAAVYAALMWNAIARRLKGAPG